MHNVGRTIQWSTSGRIGTMFGPNAFTVMAMCSAQLELMVLIGKATVPMSIDLFAPST